MIDDAALMVSQLREYLKDTFSTHLPLLQLKEEDREPNFLSRALAALTLHKLSGCSILEASQGVVDGNGDGGIDALIYMPQSRCLWVVQSKFISLGVGTPATGDTSKFKDGLENLLRGQFNFFSRNAQLKKRLELLSSTLVDSNIEVVAVLAYSGIDTLSDDHLLLFERLKAQFNRETDYPRFEPCDLKIIHTWLTGSDKDPGVDVELSMHSVGMMGSPYPTFYGQVSLADLAKLYSEHGENLVVANLRRYRGDTDVNQRILHTLEHEPETFFYLNNGLTAYCRQAEVHQFDFAHDISPKRVRARGFSVVNGAQTLGSIAKYAVEHPTRVLNGYAMIKIISLQGSDDEFNFANQITRSTNFQNQVEERDFVALDPEQVRIAETLSPSGIYYHYKQGEDLPSRDEHNFTLEEATTALACLKPFIKIEDRRGNKSFEFLCTRVLSKRASLWSQEPFQVSPSKTTSLYRHLFSSDRAALTIWRCVQAQRIVLARMTENVRASERPRKDFFESGRWLVLHLVLILQKVDQGDSLTLYQSEKSEISRRADEISEWLWLEIQPLVSNRAFKTVFSNVNDCMALKAAVMRRSASGQVDASTSSQNS